MSHLTVLPHHDNGPDATPTYLFDYAEQYRTDAHGAGLRWFREARYGLAVNYGLHSLLGKGARIQHQDKIPAAQYQLLQDRFTAENFNPVDIAECAIVSGCRYLDFPARGADGFSLFHSQHSDFSSTCAPAQRDLVAEMASVCEYHGLGLCLHYSHGIDWHHLNAPKRQLGGPNAQPEYDLADACDSAEAEDQLETYLAFVSAQVQELLTCYGPIAAICLDGIDSPLFKNPERFQCHSLYRLIRHLQAQTLVSYQQGLTGEEDFLSVEAELPEDNAAKATADIPQPQLQLDKPIACRLSLTPASWGYQAALAGSHLQENELWRHLCQAADMSANLTVNSNLLPDGSLDLEDINTLLAVGGKLEADGFP